MHQNGTTINLTVTPVYDDSLDEADGVVLKCMEEGKLVLLVH